MAVGAAHGHARQLCPRRCHPLAHGAPLGEEEVKLTKQKLGWPLDRLFYLPAQALDHFRKALEQGRKAEDEWNSRFSAYSQAFPDLGRELQEIMRGELPEGWNADVPSLSP